MEVILIEPVQSGVHVFLRYTLPRLGLPLLGALARRELGITPRIFFDQYENLDWEAIRRADLVGISTITPTAPDAYRVLERVKRLGDIPVVMGGPHVTFLPEEALGKGADFVVRGEGELAFIELLRHLRGEGIALESIRGISYREGGRFLHNPEGERISDLSTLPWPDLGLIEGHQRLRILPVMTSRGCPYRCKFCSVTSIFGHRYRFRDTDDVMAELEHLHQAWPRSTVFFYDDNFTANAERTKELLREMKRRGLPPRWTAQVRVEVVRDPELMRLMKETRCIYLYLGLESVNPATLESYHKSQTVEDIAEAVRVLHKHKISVHGMFVLGSDEDDVATLKQTVRFAKRARIDTVQFLALVPLPGTETYRELEEQGRITDRDWGKYDGHHVVFQPAKMAQHVLQKRGAYGGMRSFYSWWEVTKLGLRFQWRSMVVRIFAHLAIRRWKSDNAEWLRELKEQYKLLKKQLKQDGRTTA